MKVRTTSLDRVLWPETGFTKGAMLDYYARVAPALVPHVAGRPLMLGRWPAGVERPGFAQTECRGAPDWLPTCEVRLRGGEARRCCVADDADALLWIANQNAIELHPLPFRCGRPDEPVAVLFDLDPGEGADLDDCRRVALDLRARLADEGLDAFPKVSGSTGLHVLVPLAPGHAFPAVKSFARAMAAELAAADPVRVTDRSSRAERSGRVFVDWGQNDPSRSLVAAYSLRALPWPLVSAPVTWDEVERGGPLVFGPGEVLDRLERHGDPLAPALAATQGIGAARAG